MDRRNFLRGIALGAVTAGAPVALGPVASQARDDEVAPAGTLYPGTIYTEGTVVGHGGDRVQLVHPDTGTQDVQLSHKTSVWKVIDTTVQAIAPGDYLSLRGYPLDNGAVDAVAIWVNIGWHRGTVSDLDHPRVMTGAGPGGDLFHMTQHTLLFRGEAPAEHFAGQLQVGHVVEALGAFDKPGGVLHASRIWIS
jgi:Domain of unknown function (DUF5666)